jgi:serine protease Do
VNTLFGNFSILTPPFWYDKLTLVSTKSIIPQFGVVIAKTQPKSAQILGMKAPQGVIVVSVVQDSVAFVSGLKQGDVILKYGEKIVNDVSDLQGAVAATLPGSTVIISIWRVRQGEISITAQF